MGKHMHLSPNQLRPMPGLPHQFLHIGISHTRFMYILQQGAHIAHASIQGYARMMMHMCGADIRGR